MQQNMLYYNEIYKLKRINLFAKFYRGSKWIFQTDKGSDELQKDKKNKQNSPITKS